MRASGEVLSEILDASSSCLLVHDMQNDFIHGRGAYAASGESVDVGDTVERIAALLDSARRSSIPVVYTLFTITEEPAASPGRERSPGQPLPRLVAEGTWGWHVIDRLRPLPSDFVIRKYTVDAFEGTPLDVFLRWKRVRTTIHTGIATERGIAPTVVRARNLGYNPVVACDCVSPRKKEYRDVAIAYIGQWADMVESQEIRSIWSARAQCAAGGECSPNL